MWPWGHLAVGYLLYSLGRRWRGGRPGFPEAALVALGTQAPDLVDKPLAWSLGVLPAGRTLGHSLLVAAVVLAVCHAVVAPRYGRLPVVAFGVGYLSHLLADLPPELLAGEVGRASYLLWPLLAPPPYELEPSFVAHLQAYELGPYEAFQLLLFGVAVGVWYRDGAPGLAGTRARLARWTR